MNGKNPLARLGLPGKTPVAAIALVLLASCQAPPKVAGLAPAAPPGPEAPPAPTIGIPADPFGRWVEDVIDEGRRRGISGRTLTDAFYDINPIPKVIELDRRQPEF